MASLARLERLDASAARLGNIFRRGDLRRDNTAISRRARLIALNDSAHLVSAPLSVSVLTLTHWLLPI